MCKDSSPIFSPSISRFIRNLPQLAIPLSTLSSQRLISDYICDKILNKNIQLRLLSVSDVSMSK